MHSLAELSTLFATLDDVLIVTHERPDGDAIGSVLGLLAVLKESGRRAAAYFADPLPAAYQQFVKCEPYVSHPPQMLTHKTLICLDCGNVKRLALCEEIKAALGGFRIINIDHHPDNSLFGEVNHVDSHACSTAEIVYRAIVGTGTMTISPDAATALLLGVVMDTGGFRFDNTNASVFSLAASLAEAGADYHGIVKAMFFSRPLGQFKLLSDIGFRQVRFACEGKLAFFHLADELLRAYAVDPRDTEGLIDFVRTIEGVVVTVMTSQRGDAVKVSLRSGDPRVSVGEIARRHDGGGHELAAGCQFATTDAEQVLAQLVKEIEPLLR